MQVPSGPFGFSVRHYAQLPPPPPQYQGHQKPPSGSSFTIEALLSRQEVPRGAPGLALAPGGHYLCPPALLHPPQAAYPLLCCPQLSYHSTCRGAFYQASLSKVSAGFHSFKTKVGKSKRLRTSFSSEQLSRLEQEFARQQYMVGSERFLLASALQLTEAQVKVWFQNRRIKWRKQSLEQQQAKLAKLGLAAPPRSPGSQGHADEEEEEEEEEEFSDLDVDVDVSDADHC